MTTDLVPVVESREVLTLPSRSAMEAQLKSVREFQLAVQQLFVEGHDFGVIPGTAREGERGKPTLLKPGAEKLVKLLGLSDEYVFVERVEDWTTGFFNYIIRCELRSMQHGGLVATGLGACNSWESRYRYRWAWPRELADAQRVGLKTRSVKTKYGQQTQYRLENDDIASQVNTILKMASKRALVAAALSAGRLSDVFTQDLEDSRGEADDAVAEPVAAPVWPVVREPVASPAAGIVVETGFAVPGDEAESVAPPWSGPGDVAEDAPVSDETWRAYVQMLGKAAGLGLGPATEGYPNRRTGLSESRAQRYLSAVQQAVATVSLGTPTGATALPTA